MTNADKANCFRRRRFPPLGLACCASALAFCLGGQAYADPVSACPGVGVNAYDATAVLDTSSFAAGCVLISGAELSMNGAVAPVVDFGVPAGVTTTYTYDTAGRIEMQVDEDTGSGHATYDMVYDGSGRLISETTTDSAEPLGLTTTYSYDSQGRLMGESNSSETTSYAYDGVGRLTTLTDSTGTTDYGYDNIGRTVTATEGSFTTTYTYDALDRVTQVTDPSSRITTYTYDGLDRQIKELDPLGATTIYQYDAAGNMVTTTDRNGFVTSYSYDSHGRVSSDAEGASAVTDFVYSAPVPEPSSLLLIAGGLAAWFGLRRPRRRASAAR